LGHYAIECVYKKWKEKAQDNDDEAKLVQDNSDDEVATFVATVSDKKKGKFVHGF
jgi:hypothetical protein